MGVRVGLLDCEEGWAPKNWHFWTVVLEKTPESPLDNKEIKPVNIKRNQSWILIGRNWCWSWSSNTSATWCEELTHWKRIWRWEKLRTRREGGDRGWDGWMASPTQWTWVWANSEMGRTGNSGMLQSMELQRVRHNWATERQQYLELLNYDHHTHPF